MRIVSLLPSATEILFAVGAGDSVVGVTFECDYPSEARSRLVVSNTTLVPGMTPSEIDAEVRRRVAAGEDLYRLDEGALREISPDLIVTQDLCAVCAVDVNEVDDALEHLGCHADVLTLDPMSLDDVLASIIEVGDATGRAQAARGVVGRLRDRLARVRSAVIDRPPTRIAVLEWTDPAYCAGHWIPDMVTSAGAVPALGRAGERSRRVEWDEVRECEADAVVVAPCGYSLDQAITLAREMASRCRLPADASLWAVDANNAFVRPAPRVIDGVEALAWIAHPSAIAPRPDVATRVT